MDNKAAAPAQDPENFELLDNILPIVNGNLQRRWGYKGWGSVGFAPRQLYEYQSDVTLARRIVATDETHVAAMNEDGSSFNTSVYTPVAGIAPRMCLSRGFGYFSNGNALDFKKWGGSPTNNDVTNWGISFADQSVAFTLGPNPPGTAVNVPTSGNAWTTPNNSKVADGVFTTSTFTGASGSSDNLNTSNFGFAIPSNETIVGIQVDVKGQQTIAKNSGPIGSVGQGVIDLSLLQGGTPVGFKSATLPGANGFVTLGGSNDLWGGAWAFSDLNNSSFGVQLAAFGTHTGPLGNFTWTFQVDFVRVTVFTTSKGIQLGAPTGGGSITLVSGRQYAAAFKNSLTGHYSDLGTFSASTGPLTSQNQPLNNIPVSVDPQVDRVVILATPDGGDQTQLIQLADLPNGTTTYTDITDELTLLTLNILLDTDPFGNEFGLGLNTPPPAGLLFPTKHRGRLYGIVGATLFFSKSVADLTTSDGTIAGKFEEAWPATNQFDVSQTAETPRGLLSDGISLYIITQRHVLRLSGDSPSNFSFPDVIHAQVGAVSQDVWKPVFLEGSPVGAMWLTPDFRFIGSDFNTYQSVGDQIQGTLNTINPAAVANCRAEFYAENLFDILVLAVPTGSNTECDTLCVYDMRARQWTVWHPLDSVSALLYNIQGSGIPQLLFGAPSTSSAYVFSSALTQDRADTTPTNIPVTARTSWLDMYDPVSRKVLNEVELLTDDPVNMTLTIEGASTVVGFTTSPNVVCVTVQPSLSPRGEFKVYLASKPSHDRYYRYTFQSSSTDRNFLSAYHVEVNQFHRV